MSDAHEHADAPRFGGGAAEAKDAAAAASPELRVLIITTQFPNRARPGWAPFNRQQFAALAAVPGVRVVDVIAALPWFPGIDGLAPRSVAAGLLGLPPRDRIAGLPVRHVRALYLPRVGQAVAAPLFAASLARVVAEYAGHVDVLLAAWAHPDGCAAVRLGRMLGVPVVVKTHGSDVNVLGALRGPGAALRRALPRAARVVAVSDALARAVTSLGVSRDRIDVVRNGVDRALFRPRDRVAARRALGLGDVPLVLCPGRIEIAKGVLDLLAAFVRVRAARPDARLAFVGGGAAADALRAAVHEAGLERHVVTPGAVALEQIPTWLAAADVVAVPSWAEGLPNTVLEAQACGRPVVATDVGGIGEAIHEPALGTLVPAHAPDALAEALIDALGRTWDEGAIVRAAPRDWRDSARSLATSLMRARVEQERVTARTADDGGVRGVRAGVRSLPLRVLRRARALAAAGTALVCLTMLPVDGGAPAVAHAGEAPAPLVVQAAEASPARCAGRWNVAPAGDDGADGSSARPLRTIQRAADLAEPGDTVCVAPGLYRERVVVRRAGRDGAPITFFGAPGAVVDGGEPHADGWTLATEFGRNARGDFPVWKKRITFTGSATPYHGTLDGSYVLRLRDRNGEGQPFMADCGWRPRTCLGGDRLRNGPRGSNSADGRSNVIQGWDPPGVVDAMFGVADGWTYVAFADAGSPNGRDLTFSPKEGGAFEVVASWITLTGFTLRGANYPVWLRGADAHHVTVDGNVVRNGFYGIFVAGGAHHNMILRNDVSIAYPASLDPADPYHWFLWNAFRNNSELHRASISLSGGGAANEIAYNGVHDSFGGIDEDGSTAAGAGTRVHHNLVRTCANDGLAIVGGKDAVWSSNVLLDVNIGTRFWPRGEGGSVTYAENAIQQPAKGVEACLFFFRGSANDAIRVSQNRCKGPVGLLFGSTDARLGLPGLVLRGNTFDVASLFAFNDWAGWQRSFTTPGLRPDIVGLLPDASVPPWAGGPGLSGARGR